VEGDRRALSPGGRRFLDPLTFNPTSMLGVAGIMDVYRAGGITIANAPGTGIADDKAIYSFMPEIVEFYTGEKPILKNVPTWRCASRRRWPMCWIICRTGGEGVHGSGGYGMLIGPTSSKAEIAAFEKKLRARPDNYIAQPTLSLSTVPIFTKAGLAPRHVDLRPFVLVARKASRSRRAADARGAEEGIAGGEFVAGRGHQGQLGAGGIRKTYAWTFRLGHFLDGALSRTRRKHRAPAGRGLSHGADARQFGRQRGMAQRAHHAGAGRRI
jgi:hypothetical protein